MKAFIENLYYNKTFAQNNNPITNLYEDYEKFCKEKGFEKIACYKKYGTLENLKKTWKKEINYMLVKRAYKYGEKVETFEVINFKGENYIKTRDTTGLIGKKVEYDNISKVTVLK